MSKRGDRQSDQLDDESAVAHEVWRLMSELVLDNQRRREVSEAVGISFGRTRAVRRIAKKPMSMSELASALGIEKSNATVLVNELEDQGLVLRKGDPGDRRTRRVVATRDGKKLAQRADEILKTPPEGLSDLDQEDLKKLRQVLSSITPSE